MNDEVGPAGDRFFDKHLLGLQVPFDSNYTQLIV